MNYHQDPTNLAAKRASSAEMNRWRDQGVDPELLQSASNVLLHSAKVVVDLTNHEAPTFEQSERLGLQVAQAATQHVSLEF
jgi:hypothetical protein